ncbi:MAG: tRNA dimethylallyltransferase [Microgenomates group bacterium GW2011_GWF2_47_9]|nr:MAG: tRNA dimethylallyltransferase [Microgenomates group bacterium GW2011_GWF2_47_9]
MTQKLLCIVGPTGTGKTSLAVDLSKQLPSVLISADSSQVYRGMDIVTGKDHPQDVILHGIDLVSPSDPLSVSLWYQKVKDLLTKSPLPIIVGGTGLYVKAITEGIPTMSIPPNPSLRAELEPLSVLDLQLHLAGLNSKKFSEMNNSDKHNKRRLVRAIEIASAITPNFPKNISHDTLIIGLKFNNQDRYLSNLKSRVKARVEGGAIEETKLLLSKYNADLLSHRAIGYRSIIAYLGGSLTRSAMLTSWLADEYAYSKRQMTWFSKIKNVKWYECEDPHLFEKLAELVTSWYHK